MMLLSRPRALDYPRPMLRSTWPARVAPFVLAAMMHGIAAPAFAQQQDLIGRGRSLFEDQQYEESIQTLSAALLRPNMTKPQRIEVYRLLALNYITLGRKDEAESAVRGLLALEPSYALPQSESPRFRDFFDTVRKKWEAEGRPGLVTEGAPAAPAPVGMKHASPSQVEPNTEIPLTVQLEDPQGRVFNVRLFFRTGSKGKFEQQEAPLANNTAKSTIPKEAVKPPLVEYYFQGFDKGGLPVVSRGDAAAPLRVAVPEKSSPWVLPLAIGGSAIAAAGIAFIIMGAAGVFSGGQATVNVGVRE
jgi:tetratricopeptide (TPR) repeat protein